MVPANRSPYAYIGRYRCISDTLSTQISFYISNYVLELLVEVNEACYYTVESVATVRGPIRRIEGLPVGS